MWLYEGKEFEPSESDLNKYVGFIYLITHLGTGRCYIGKKLFKKRKKITRNKKKKNILVESNWREYTGSCRELNEDIEKDPRVIKEILGFAQSKGELSYLEMVAQIERDVLRDDSYYNNIIQVRIHASHLRKRS